MAEPKAQKDTADTAEPKAAKAPEQNYFLPELGVSVKATSQAEAIAKAEKLVKTEGDKQ